MNWQQRLNQQLGLKIEGQDWGIENSDPHRVLEFIAFYGRNIPQYSWEPEALAELILASAQYALDEGVLSPQAQQEVKSFFARSKFEFPIEAEYWLSLNPKEWRLTQLLQQSGACA